MISRFKLLAIACFIPLLAATCDSEQRQIKDVAYNYLDAMGNYRFDKARPYATKATQENTLTFFEESIMPSVDKSYIKKNTPAKIQIKGIRMVNDRCVRVAFRKKTPIKVQNDSITLVKVGKKWKVDQVIGAPGSSQPIMEKHLEGDSTVKSKPRIDELDPKTLEQARKDYQKQKNATGPVRSAR